MRIIVLIDDARFLRGFLYLMNVQSWPKAAYRIGMFRVDRTSALHPIAAIRMIGY